MPQKPYKTQLVYVEGPDESAFIKYLRKHPYKKDIRGCGMKSEIIIAQGGGFQDVFDEALKRKENGYDRIVVVMDYDWMGDTPAQRKNQLRRLEEQIQDKNTALLIVNKPCLEGLLLSILEDENFSEEDGCDSLKSHFQKQYLDKSERKIPDNYTKFFSREKIEIARGRVSSLDLLIRAIQNEV